MLLRARSRSPALTIDGHEIENGDASNNPIVVPSIAPAPSPYDGQFIQMDVDAVTAQ